MHPDSYTNQELRLDVGDGHELYLHDWGNKDAVVPFIFLHGGPGGHVKDKHKAAFDPNVQRVIFFDQRGSGLSTPYGSTEHNTTAELISDITTVADRLGIDSFNLHGGSWGSALALAYAIANPARVNAVVIGGVFTGSKTESAWVDQGGFKPFYPEVWQSYLDRTPKEHWSSPTAYHFDKAQNGTTEERKYSSYAYQCMEAAIIQLDDRFYPEDYADYDPAGMQVEIHYLANGCFLADNYILDNAAKLTMPVHIVQGRYDMVCPPQTAYKLHQTLPNSQLYWTQSGHLVGHEAQNIFAAIIANL